MIAALLLAAACQCPPPAIDWAEADRAIEEAVRETDRKLSLDKQRAELEEIVRRNREAFEKAHEQPTAGPPSTAPPSISVPAATEEAK